ncbi:MAG: hypothetical protein OK438_02710 [Thaumarchaeota archaeon]|nr:hypothetical protein [Nitrososphaerota archaeon]
MKQEFQTVGAPDFGQDRYLPKQSFAALLALARKSLTSGELRLSLGVNPSEYRELLDGLHRDYLVDVVSQLDGNEVRETLRLTDEGELALLHTLEKMCELPEQ